MLLSDVCLSLTSGLSREQRGLGRPKLAEVTHVTRDSYTTFKVKRSKVTRPLFSLPCWCVRQLQQWAWERVGREKLLQRCRLLDRARLFGAHGRGEGHLMAAAHLQLAMPHLSTFCWRWLGETNGIWSIICSNGPRGSPVIGITWNGSITVYC